MYWKPPSSRISLVEKLVCAPAPFQSPFIGLASSVPTTSKSSAVRYSSQRATPQLVADLERADRADLELPLPGHHLGVDAADGQAGGEAVVECSSTMSRPKISSAPTPQ